MLLLIHLPVILRLTAILFIFILSTEIFFPKFTTDFLKDIYLFIIFFFNQASLWYLMLLPHSFWKLFFSLTWNILLINLHISNHFLSTSLLPLSLPVTLISVLPGFLFFSKYIFPPKLVLATVLISTTLQVYGWFHNLSHLAHSSTLPFQLPKGDL